VSWPVKEASANLEQLAAIVEGRRHGFAVLSGDDRSRSRVALGAEGVISVVSNEAPRLMSEMMDAASASDFEKRDRSTTGSCL
jgi:4-hydroxy-tetrahydrodipicolinate synthase